MTNEPTSPGAGAGGTKQHLNAEEVENELQPRRGGTLLHSGIAPIDPASGEHHRLTIYATETAKGFEIHKFDAGHWPVDDLDEAFRIAPGQLPKLRTALQLDPEGDITQVIAQRIRDGRVAVPGADGHWMDVQDFPSRWFRELGIDYTHVQRFVPN